MAKKDWAYARLNEGIVLGRTLGGGNCAEQDTGQHGGLV